MFEPTFKSRLRSFSSISGLYSVMLSVALAGLVWRFPPQPEFQISYPLARRLGFVGDTHTLMLLVKKDKTSAQWHLVHVDADTGRVTKEVPCPKCKTANKIRTPYCTKCAEPLTDSTAPCAMCGKFNRMGSRCCIHCGNRLR